MIWRSTTKGSEDQHVWLYGKGTYTVQNFPSHGFHHHDLTWASPSLESPHSRPHEDQRLDPSHHMNVQRKGPRFRTSSFLGHTANWKKGEAETERTWKNQVVRLGALFLGDEIITSQVCIYNLYIYNMYYHVLYIECIGLFQRSWNKDPYETTNNGE